MTTVIYDRNDPVTLEQTARSSQQALWVSPEDLAAVTGWTLKPQGLCRDDACIPLPQDGSWLDAEGRVDLAAFAAREGRPVVVDEGRDVWAFGSGRQPSPGVRAPDFTFPDLDGQLHPLSDFRGKKVFLYTWGSYCGCSFDPPVWETVYQELRDHNFEMISVALDSAGAAAVEDRIRPQALDERPVQIQKLRGWNDGRWHAKVSPSHLCLIDEDHELAVDYGMSNVPMAVWIDEQGNIVRPPEPAGVSDHFRSMDPDTFDLPPDDAQTLVDNRERYIAALKDWVVNGSQSQFALSPEEVRERMRSPRPEELEAALHMRIGRWLFQLGDTEGAEEHTRAASALCPEKWNYRRQAMVLNPEYVGALNVSPGYWEAMDNLGGNAFYPDIDMPGLDGAAHFLDRDAERSTAS